MIKAVIFDFDGTLIDSEEIHIQVLKESIKEKTKVDISSNDIAKLAGMTYRNKIKHLLVDKGIECDVEEIATEAYNHYLERFESQIKLQKGVKQALKTIHSLNLKIGLYSPNKKFVIETTLKKFNILAYYKVIISLEDVKRSKPDPEGYFIAARKLNVKPEECLVFEDTPTGFAAAKSAGMKTIVLKNPYLKDPKYPGVDALIDGFERVDKEFLKQF